MRRWSIPSDTPGQPDAPRCLPRRKSHAVLRDAIESDVEPLARLHIASWQAAYRGILPDEVLDHLSLEKQASILWRFLRRSPTPIARFSWRLDDSKLVGFTSFYPGRDEDVDSSCVVELTTCYVHPDYWRSGIGTALWSEAQNRMVARKFSECVLWVFRENHPARRFYERIGFIFDGTEQSTQSVTPSPIEVRYRRSI